MIGLPLRHDVPAADKATSIRLFEYARALQIVDGDDRPFAGRCIPPSER
jgi:hypothetical protein